MPHLDTLQEELAAVRDQANLLYSPGEVEEGIERVAQQMNRDYSGAMPVLITVMNGGLVFAGQLVTRLSFPLQMDYLHVSRYRGETRGGVVQWIASPATSLTGRHVVIVDDILDEGETLQAIITACQAQDVASVATCVLVDKHHNRKVIPGLKADYTALHTRDVFLFGMGMDYQGYWRNLPGIYAVG